jgi:succinate dehydrogenase / fumarate reductase cytochrome b subunit
MLLQRQKRILTIAGSIMLAYLVFHMLSNLSFFADMAYEQFYQWYNQAIIRWGFFIVFAGAIFVHAVIAFRIRRVNAVARTVGYAKHDKLHIPAWMVSLSIVFLLAFICIHIIQTLGFETSAVKAATINLFNSPWNVLFYLAGLFVLTMHLAHSAGNILQTLGKTSVTCQTTVIVCTLLLTGGFAAIPLYIYFVMP